MVTDKIKEVIDTIKPFLINDGGDIEFVKYEDHIVYIKMLGACADCYMLDVTIKDMIENTIIEEIPEVEGVVNLTNLSDNHV